MSTSPRPPDTSMRATAPSWRFWESARNATGAALALLAGLMNVGVVVWPLVNSVGRGDVNPTWRIIGVAAGIVYVAAFLFADRRWQLSRLLLVVGAVVQILAALTLGRAYDEASGTSGLLIGLFDFVPAIIALVAAFMIGRAPTPAELSDD